MVYIISSNTEHLYTLHVNYKRSVFLAITKLVKSSQCLLGCDKGEYCSRIPMFQMTLLPPSSVIMDYHVAERRTHATQIYSC
jgi:hypothetical protein